MLFTKIAWLGHLNYGDDVMAEMVKTYMTNLLENYRERIWCEGEIVQNDTTKSIYPVGFLPKVGREYFVHRTLKQSDGLIIGGGSILHSENSIRWKLEGANYFKEHNPAAKAVGVCLSVGPFSSAQAELQCQALFNVLDAVSLRDDESYQLAKSWKPRCKLVRAADLAGDYIDRNHFVGHGYASASINTIGLSLVGNIITEASKPKWISLIRTLSNAFNRVILFGFCGSDKFGDQYLLQALNVKVDRPNVSVEIYNGDAYHFTGSLAKCDFFIGQRLHSIIISYFLGTPFLALSYHKKCADFYELCKLDKRFLITDSHWQVSDILSRIGHYDMASERKNLLARSLVNYEVLNEFKC